jgi:hypothetical protein
MIGVYIAAAIGLLSQVYFVFDSWRVYRDIKRRSSDLKRSAEEVQRIAAKLQADALELSVRRAAFDVICQQHGIEIVTLQGTKH